MVMLWNSFYTEQKIQSGKRFGFVKFINVFNEERLVNNLCTVWIGRFKLMANLARFKRENKTGRGKEGRTERWREISDIIFVLPANAGRFYGKTRLGGKIGGVPFKLWTVKTFSRIASKWGDLMDVDEDELNYHSKRIQMIKKKREEDDVSDECNFDGKPEAQEENNIFEESEEEKVQETEFGVPSGEKVNKSEDPFGIYSLLQKNKTNMENKVNEEITSYSPPRYLTHRASLRKYISSKVMLWGISQRRLEILNKIHQVQKNQASEISQKAKIKWAIEGDENVKFFHGILNKKRSQSQIRGVMANVCGLMIRSRSVIEQTQLDSMAEIMKTISLVPRVDRYIWSFERNDGIFSVAFDSQDLNTTTGFPVEVLSTRWDQILPIKVLERFLQGENVEYMEVNSYESLRSFARATLIRSNIKVIIEVDLLRLVVGYVEFRI
ncbi:hypothetical protein Tco_0468780 [Tanacetum coccineum]